jgi:hypothetical protein
MKDRLFSWARRMDRGLFPWMGPAQLGAGYQEEPYRPPVDPLCPICGGPLARHVVQRTADQHHATRLICPAP